jgi:hypothetical protein
MHTAKPLLILVAGPYRSGTNDNPELIAANVKAMTDTALEIYRMGHMPVLGEWFALPLIEAAKTWYSAPTGSTTRHKSGSTRKKD